MRRASRCVTRRRFSAIRKLVIPPGPGTTCGFAVDPKAARPGRHGRDARGPQSKYRYHAEWRRGRATPAKFAHIVGLRRGSCRPFAKRVPGRPSANRGLPRAKGAGDHREASRGDADPHRQCRICPARTASYGLTTLRNRHVAVRRQARVAVRVPPPRAARWSGWKARGPPARARIVPRLPRVARTALVPVSR